MSRVSLNLIAVTVFVFTLTSLLGPLVNLSPAVPAIATFSILSLATLDTLGWQGRGITLLLDWLASFSKEHRDRIAHHEAGHFLVAHQLGIPVTGYALNAWEAFRQGYPGSGSVQFDTQELEQELRQTALSAQLLNRYCTIWMAGIAAETLIYREVEGGNDDRQKLRGILTQLGFPAAECLQKERWAILQAKTLIQNHEREYKALVSAMKQKATVEECRQAMATNPPEIGAET
jgi:hypothetical protein